VLVADERRCRRATTATRRNCTSRCPPATVLVADERRQRHDATLYVSLPSADCVRMRSGSPRCPLPRAAQHTRTRTCAERPARRRRRGRMGDARASSLDQRAPRRAPLCLRRHAWFASLLSAARGSSTCAPHVRSAPGSEAETGADGRCVRFFHVIGALRDVLHLGVRLAALRRARLEHVRAAHARARAQRARFGGGDEGGRVGETRHVTTRAARSNSSPRLLAAAPAPSCPQ
jgi:hypothetical protein